jgi:hypothetical protein
MPAGCVSHPVWTYARALKLKDTIWKRCADRLLGCEAGT